MPKEIESKKLMQAFIPLDSKSVEWQSKHNMFKENDIG